VSPEPAVGRRGRCQSPSAPSPTAAAVSSAPNGRVRPRVELRLKKKCVHHSPGQPVPRPARRRNLPSRHPNLTFSGVTYPSIQAHTYTSISKYKHKNHNIMELAQWTGTGAHPGMRSDFISLRSDTRHMGHDACCCSQGFRQSCGIQEGRRQKDMWI